MGTSFRGRRRSEAHMSLDSTSDTSYCGRAEARPENVPELRNGAVAFAAGAGAAPAALDSVKLAGSEALTNVVRHAYIESDEPGPMIVETWVDRDAVLMVVCDEGCGLKPRPDSPGLGLGLPLLAQVAD